MLVTGARGQLAGAIVQTFSDGSSVRAYTHAEMDISDYDAVMARVEPDPPDVIINCAAYNNVDLAEDEPARALNATAPCPAP